jgi:hypothetical protein
MCKLYATLETSKGKTVSISDNESIIATVYEGNMKAYSVTIYWTDIADIALNEDDTKLPEFHKEMGAIVTTREWRNREKTNDRQDNKKVFYGEEPTKADIKKELEDREEDNKHKKQGHR